MALSRITGQDKSGTSATAALTVTYPSTPTQNNLLIAIVYCSGTGATVTIPGWTQDKTIDDSAGHSISIFSKIAGVSETSAVAIADGSASGSIHGLIFEYSGNAASSALDKTISASSGSSSVNSLASGSTPTTTQADELLIAAAGVAGSGSSPTWTGSFTGHLNTTRSFMADQIVSATGAYATTFGYTGTAVKTNVAIATYKALAASPGVNSGFLGFM